ncbi:hypothetical protein RhiirC2_801626, partial [Rhizophagus irregularis]
WNEVTADTIKNCWNHVKILSDAIPRDNDENDDSNIDSELNRAIEALHLSDMMQVKEFLTIPEEDVIYEFLNISEFEDMFKSGTTDHPDEVDDSSEMEIIHINEALRSLKTVNLFLLQQENAGEQIKLAEIGTDAIPEESAKGGVSASFTLRDLQVFDFFFSSASASDSDSEDELLELEELSSDSDEEASLSEESESDCSSTLAKFYRQIYGHFYVTF